MHKPNLIGAIDIVKQNMNMFTDKLLGEFIELCQQELGKRE